MYGNGRPTGGQASTTLMRRKRAAFLRIRAAAVKTRATTRVSHRSKFPARFLKAARIYARRITAAATARLRATRKRLIRPQATSDFGALSEKGATNGQQKRRRRN